VVPRKLRTMSAESSASERPDPARRQPRPDGMLTGATPNRELLLRGEPRGLVSDQTDSRTALDKLASAPVNHRGSYAW